MGKMLMANSSSLLSKNRTKKMCELRVKIFFEKFHAMKKMSDMHPFFEEMIRAIILEAEDEEKQIISPVETKLALLTAGDGRHLGASFLRCLTVTATEEGAFEVWVHKYVGLSELNEDFVWFRR